MPMDHDHPDIRICAVLMVQGASAMVYFYLENDALWSEPKQDLIHFATQELLQLKIGLSRL